jgi:hypothetical protein
VGGLIDHGVVDLDEGLSELAHCSHWVCLKRGEVRAWLKTRKQAWQGSPAQSEIRRI